MSKTKVRSVGLFLLAIGFALGAKCPEFPELEDIEITAIHEDMIEFKMEARGIINIDEDCDTYEISTAEILAELEELGVDVADVDTILMSGMFAGDVDYFETAGINRAMADMMVEVTRADTPDTAIIVNAWAAPCAFQNAIPVFPLALDNCGAAGDEPCFISVPVEADGVRFINDLFADVLADIKAGVSRTYEVTACWNGCSLPDDRTTNFDWKLQIHFDVAGTVIVESPRT